MDTDTNYKKLIRMIHSISKYSDPIDPIGDIQEILDSGYDINYAMPNDCRVKEWRGCTTAHIIVKELPEKYLGAAIDLLIKFNANVTRQNHDGYSPVHLLFQVAEESYYPRDVLECLEKLLIFQMESNNATNPRCKNGVSHLHLACLRKNLKVVEFFLTAGVSVHEAINDNSRLLPGYKPMHIALRNADKKMVQLLVNYGADLKCSNVDGMTPLQLICYEELLDRFFYKDIYLRNSEKNKRVLKFISVFYEDDSIGLNQLHRQCIEKKDAKEFEEFDKLLNGADVNSHVKFDAPVWSGFTALHFAAQNNLEMVMLLLGKGADLLAKDANGITPLDLCCNNYKPSVIGSILKTQKESGCIKFQNGENLTDFIDMLDNQNELENYLKTTDVNNVIPVDSPLWPGYSFLHLAVLLSGEKQVKLCLEYGANFLIKDVKNMTALHLAFRLRKQYCISDILNAHTNISENPVDNDNLSHFHIACIFSDTKVVEAFLNFGIDPNIPTSLSYIVKRSLLFFENVEMQIPAGSTALHIAATVKFEGLIKLLVNSKVDPNLRDSENFTWVHRISFNSYSSYHKYLWEHPDSLKFNPVAPGGLSHFHIACCTEDVRAVEALLPLVTDINEPINSELMKYVKPKYCPVTKRFRFMGFEVHTVVGDTPLHLAGKTCCSSNEIIDLLLINGADVAAKNSEGHNPVYIFCKERIHKRVPNILKSLIREFKNKGKSSDGLTALHFACAMKDISLIREFIEAGEDFNSQIDVDSQMWPGQTPLSILIKFDDNNPSMYPKYPLKYDTINLFLEYFLIKLENSNNKELHELAKRRRITSSQSQELIINKDKLTAFHVCCMGDDPDLVERFILSGVDINAQVDELTTPFTSCKFDNSRAGFTPLHYAVMDGSDSVLEMLLKYNTDFTIEDVRGRTPIHLAAEKCFAKVTIFLRLCIIDGNIKNTLMDSLCKNKNMCAEDCLSLLKLDFKYDIDHPTKLFDHLIFWTRKLPPPEFKKVINSIEVFDEILKYKDSLGRNVIHHLVSTKLYLNVIRNWSRSTNKDFPKNVEVLLDKGCELDHQDINGKTPLRYAIDSKQLEIIDSLLKIGADINVSDKYGVTPYVYVYEADHWSLYDTNYGENYEFRYLFEYDYMKQLQAAGLYLNETNEECSKTHSYLDELDNYEKVIYGMAEREICTNYSVRTLLTNSIITRFPLIPLDQRREILKYFESDALHQEFPDFSALFKLQHRKILKSLKLFEPTFNSLRNLLDPRLPDHVLESIMTYLSIYDWSNLQNTLL